MGSDAVSPELIAFDRHGCIRYKGYCNITYTEKQLQVEPMNKEVASIVAPLKHNWHPYLKNNIIFVFAGHLETKDFALVYPEKGICKVMYDRIVPEEVNTDASGKKKKKRAMKNVIVELNRRFLRPICKEVREESDSKITAILKDWLDGFSDKTREEPMNVVKQEKAYDFLYPNNNPFVVRPSSSEKQKNSKADDRSNDASKSPKNQNGVKKRTSLSQKKKESVFEDDSEGETSLKPKDQKNEKQRARKRKTSDNEDDPAVDLPKRPKDNNEKNVMQQTSRKQSNNEDHSESETVIKPKTDKTQKAVKQRARKRSQNNSDSDDKSSKNQKDPKKRTVVSPLQKHSTSDDDSSVETLDVKNKFKVLENNNKKDVKKQTFVPRKQSNNENDSDSETCIKPKTPKIVKQRARKRSQNNSDSDDKSSKNQKDPKRRTVVSPLQKYSTSEDDSSVETLDVKNKFKVQENNNKKDVKKQTSVPRKQSNNENFSEMETLKPKNHQAQKAVKQRARKRPQNDDDSDDRRETSDA